jgi:hypothetical protein
MVTSLKRTPKVSFLVIVEACELVLGMYLKYNLTSWCIVQLLPQMMDWQVQETLLWQHSSFCGMPLCCIQHGGVWLVKCIFSAVVMPAATCFHLELSGSFKNYEFDYVFNYAYEQDQDYAEN